MSTIRQRVIIAIAGIALATPSVASGVIVHQWDPSPVDETVPTVCEEGWTLAEDNTCVPPGYYDDEPTPAPAPVPSPDEGVSPEASFPDITLPACPTEDSEDCYWDASARDNGEGTSFFRYGGVTYYPEG